MSRRMANAPVYFTIGQVQHNPLMGLESFIPAIQERMRKVGFPDFKQTFQQQISFGALSPDSPQQAAPTVSNVGRYVFSDISNTSGFVLQPTTLSFQTTAYDTFEPFLERLQLGLSILSDAVAGIAFTERVGLRYVDAVLPNSGEVIAQYVAPALLGLPASLKMDTEDHELSFLYSFTEASLVHPTIGQVISRTIAQHGPVGFPADLVNDIKIAERFRNFSGEHTVIDTDGSFTGREEFDAAKVGEHFLQLHGLIDRAFHGSVTDYARSVWRGDKSA